MLQNIANYKITLCDRRLKGNERGEKDGARKKERSAQVHVQITLSLAGNLIFQCSVPLDQRKKRALGDALGCAIDADAQ